VQFVKNINAKDLNQNMAINIRLLCGADLLESFAIPGLWKDDDVSNVKCVYYKLINLCCL
jgi:nicotinamide mononucleotide adenylyltransferase